MKLFFCKLVRALLSLRYRVRVAGREEIARRGRGGILFLPNHPALIDPVIVVSELYPLFAPRTLADHDQIDRPGIRNIAAWIGTHAIPDVAKGGDAVRPEVERVIGECIAGLKSGGNLLLYPAGHIYRQALEDLGGNSAVETILREVPDARVVLVRTRGLWGSSFSRASGKAPDFARNLRRCIRFLLANGIFFGPRREVTLQLVEPADLPRTADRPTLNRFLENVYNQDAPPNTYVPYTIWEKGGPHPAPEPPAKAVAGDVGAVPASTAEIVFRRLREATGRSAFRPEETLAGDLGLDSLARVDLALWVEKEFGMPVGDDDILKTVGDVLLAACGNVVGTTLTELQPIAPKWFVDPPASVPVALPEGGSLTEVFLAQARRQPGRIILTDQTGGSMTYRDVITAIMVLTPQIERVNGRFVGIMLPASAGAVVVYFATLFAGKVPVMVNWTAGTRNMIHSLDLLGVQCVLTAGRLVQKIESQGGNLGGLKGRFLLMEDLHRRITTKSKIAAALRVRLGWSALARRKADEIAVVLFTSGSESLPKAVPLTHGNLLTNMRDVASVFRFLPSDRLIGMLPPFHSFGITITMALPLCAGMPTVYHPNPTEGGRLARLIEAYRVSLLVGTPTFLNGILRAAGPGQLQSLRAVIAGAEKCPPAVYEAVTRVLPNLVLLEGYGITECSPVVSVNDERQPRPYTIGKVLPSLRHVLLNVETGRRAETGRPGMLILRGPSIFHGYLNYEGASPFLEFDGVTWYRTGDLVTEDAGGVLTFAGRLKRFVKIGGEMISLPAIEEVLARHYAGPDDEGPVVAVESSSAESNPELFLFTVKDLDRETVNQEIRAAGLSPLHNIRFVRKLAQIPTLGTGKTDYRALKSLLVTGAGAVG